MTFYWTSISVTSTLLVWTGCTKNLSTCACVLGRLEDIKNLKCSFTASHSSGCGSEPPPERKLQVSVYGFTMPWLEMLQWWSVQQTRPLWRRYISFPSSLLISILYILSPTNPFTPNPFTPNPIRTLSPYFPCRLLHRFYLNNLRERPPFECEGASAVHTHLRYFSLILLKHVSILQQFVHQPFRDSRTKVPRPCSSGQHLDMCADCNFVHWHSKHPPCVDINFYLTHSAALHLDRLWPFCPPVRRLWLDLMCPCERHWWRPLKPPPSVYKWVWACVTWGGLKAL